MLIKKGYKMKKTETINSPIYSELDPNRKVIREIPSLRGENIKQFLMSDKTIQVAMYDEPVHFEKNGTWNDIDNDLYQTEEGGYKKVLCDSFLVAPPLLFGENSPREFQ